MSFNQVTTYYTLLFTVVLLRDDIHEEGRATIEDDNENPLKGEEASKRETNQASRQACRENKAGKERWIGHIKGKKKQSYLCLGKCLP